MVVLITALYVGSVVNPLAHLHGLPVPVVNQDRTASLAAGVLQPGLAAASRQIGRQLTALLQVRRRRAALRSAGSPELPDHSG